MNQVPRIDIKHIQKFDGTNYQQYKHGLTMELELHELIDLVEVINPKSYFSL
jgi:hypothetical protein